ncbi:hypothetical protein PPMP20_01185 [Paraburkholderia phymatum]|uniref:hypothetical protein n=1 Tax=Paraburkholderia phymatum TaxID=148447 RepID=UPI0005A25C6F|nr:hypothetical protein [Paraburkholderia phymatum]
MKRLAPRFCTALALVLAVGVLYFYRGSALSLVVAVLLLACPVWVIWTSLRLSRESQRDINEAVERESDSRHAK